MSVLYSIYIYVGPSYLFHLMTLCRAEFDMSSLSCTLYPSYRLEAYSWRRVCISRLSQAIDFNDKSRAATVEENSCVNCI